VIFTNTAEAEGRFTRQELKSGFLVSVCKLMMASTGSAWVKKYPVYQIDFACVAAGKRVASTKRRIRW
jgi:hypothetical protein